MKLMHLCRGRLREGARSEEEVSHWGKKIIVSRIQYGFSQQRLYPNRGLSVHDLGWQRAYILRCR